MGWGLLASVAMNGLSKTGKGSASDMSKDNLFLRGLRFDKGKDWWKDSLTGFGWLGGDEGGESEYVPPPFWDNPDLADSMDSLKGISYGLLNGELPDYYKSLGETGGEEFEGMMDLTNRDIQTSAAESMAAKGRASGGQLPAVTASAVSDASTKARYADYERSLEGKQYLLGQGVDLEKYIANLAINNQAQYNNYSLGHASGALDASKFDYEKEVDSDNQTGEMIGTIANSAGGEDGWLSMFTNLFKKNSGTVSGVSKPNGVSSLGSIGVGSGTTLNGAGGYTNSSLFAY